MTRHAYLIALAATGLIAGCTTFVAGNDASKQALQMMKSSFRENGQARLDRLEQDDVQATCSRFETQARVPPDIARRIEQEQLKTVRYPADGRLLGDWKAGEAIAQSGVGKQFSDDPARPSGGNCYACHQLSRQEVAFGTIGPSLLDYGKLRGNSDEVRKYTYAKVYNSQAFAACSNMPRFGHNGILTEQQIRDVVALLLDPASPVNK